eukprot:CAMPEP_0180643154 /NCGR_PEP_ID=MMETSP1037_2-20121125/47632_1 /TAXON_ID=632150 /ORGANISM="Azadinium spinosum, Strain 3D9" /LENGTH=173 /DNA_ID=CAMNT_0022666581 /DNA_START=44 /DNA_END=562 /DNA_ORIENTATION=-
MADFTYTEVVSTAFVIEKLVGAVLLNQLEKQPVVLTPGEELNKSVERIVFICSNGCFLNPSLLGNLFASAEKELKVLPIIAEDSFRFPSPAFFARLEDEVRAPLKTVSSKYTGNQLVLIIKQIFKEIAVVIQPADYSSTITLLRIKGETVSKRIWDGTNALKKPGEMDADMNL